MASPCHVKAFAHCMIKMQVTPITPKNDMVESTGFFEVCVTSSSAMTEKSARKEESRLGKPC